MDKRLIQQGDVLFFEVNELPKGLKEVPRDSRGIVFAEGEHTGHYHGTQGMGGTALLEDTETGMRYFRTDVKQEVTHQEHGTVTLDPGLYRIGIVREIDPFTQEIEKVRD